MKKKIKRILATICFIILFVEINNFFHYILVDDIESITRIMMHQLYNSPENIDVLFVGSSHVYRSLIPEITDEAFDAYTFNAGSSSQMMDGSLAIIREALTKNDIKEIYLETYYDIANLENKAERSEMTATYIISDYMKPSFRKVFYLLQASPKKYYTNSFIVARRNWEKFFDSEYVKNMIIAKNKESYKNYEWVRNPDAIEYYVDRGFVANDGSVPENVYWNTKAYGDISAVNKITDKSDWKKDLQRIISLCKEKDIEIILFVAPMPEETIVGKDNYDEYSQMVKGIAQENNIKYYDFNLCKKQYFDTNDITQFMDEDHLNTKGAKHFSQLFGDFFMGRIKEADLFYNSLAEKIADEEPIVYGVGGPFLGTQGDLLTAKIISNRSNEIEYRIVKITDRGKQDLVQDFSPNAEFSFPYDEHGIINIEWRIPEEEKEIKLLTLEY